LKVLDASRYPDLVRAGGLPAALREAAARLGVDIGQFEVTSGPAQFDSVITDTGRGRISVLLGADRRLFGLAIFGRGHSLAAGSTSDLDDAVRVIATWCRGTTLRELRERFPFMTYDAMAEAYEAGRLAAAQWDLMLTDPDLVDIRPLLVDAHAHEVLRSMVPMVSHLTLLRLVRDIDVRTKGEVWVALKADGTYVVESTTRPGSRRVVDSVDEAVRVALSLAMDSG
jgi:Family of unknown function (DUF6193)